MSDTTDKPDPQAPQNQPNAGVISPILQQITGGNTAALDAAQKGQAAATQSVYGDPAKWIADITSRIGAVFQAGQSSGAAQADKAVALAKAQSDALVQAGVLGATKDRGDALALAARDAATASRAAALHLGPNDPATIADNAEINKAHDVITANSAKLTEMRNQNFFDNPATYLLDHVVRIPILEGRTEDTLSDMKNVVDAQTEKTKSLQNGAVVDLAMNSVNTASRAELIYKQDLANTVALGIKPAIDAQQTEISAYNLADNQRRTGIEAAHLSLDAQIAKNNQQNELARLSISNADLTLAKNRDLREDAMLHLTEAQHRMTMATAQWELDNSKDLAPDRKALLEAQVANEKAALGWGNQRADIEAGRFKIEQEETPLRQKLLGMQGSYFEQSKNALIQQQEAKTAELTSLRNEILKKDSRDKQTVSELNDTLNYFGAGGRPISDANAIPKEQRDALLTMTTNLRAFQQPARTPADALMLIKAAGIPINQMPVGHQATFNALNDIEQAVIQKVQQIQPGEEKPTGQVLTQRIDSGVAAYVSNEQNDISSSNKIFIMPTVNSILSSTSWGKNNPVVKAMEPMTVDGAGNSITKNIDGNLLLNTAAKMVSDKQLSVPQAVAALKDFAKNTLTTLRETGGFAKAAVPVDEDRFVVGYQRAGSMLGDSHDRVNLSNTADTQAKLLKQISGTAFKQHIQDMQKLPGAIKAGQGLYKELFDKGN